MRRGKGLKKALEICLPSFDQELGASRHQNREVGEREEKREQQCFSSSSSALVVA